MKKFFSLVIALVAAMAINATDYYVSGIGGWAEPGTNAANKLTGDGDVLSVTFDRINSGAEFKIFANTGWTGPEYGAANSGDVIVPNGAAYTLASPASNLKVDIAEGHYLTNATLTFNATTLACTITGTDVDGTAEPATYQLVGGCTNNWSTADAVQFEDVAGVLTATVADLNGSFKIIQDRQWAHQWATNWETGGGLALGVPYVLGAKTDAGEPANLALANPFGGYHNAVLTLTGMGEGETPTLTLVSGDIYVTENNWYFPGAYQSWKCDETGLCTAVAGQTNTFEILIAELEGEFKVSYGNWAVEFGAQQAGDIVVPNTPYAMKYGKDNLKVEEKLIDVTVTIVVDYENVGVLLTLGVEATALDQIAAQKGAQKIIENGKVVIIKDGIRYTATGAQL